MLYGACIYGIQKSITEFMITHSFSSLKLFIKNIYERYFSNIEPEELRKCCC